MGFLIDDILLSPAKFVHFIARSIHEEAMRQAFDEEGTRKRLRQLYIQLESGKISEAEFEEREEEIINHREKIKQIKGK